MPPLEKILLCHNHYQQFGGEDRVFADEGSLLESRGHDVVRFTMHNDVVRELGRVQLARKTIWNSDAAQQLRAVIRRERPDIMHCTNIFPLISPAAYSVAKEEGVAVVQSLHNYRMICPKAQLFRNGGPCEKCVGKTIAWPALVHRCYRESLSASAAVVAMSAYHWMKGTWTDQVDQYIALTEFSKQKLIDGGLPSDRVTVKPNFIYDDPGVGEGDEESAIFVGRLSPEKGIDTLLAAWSTLTADIRLKIVGDGPLANRVRAAAEADKRIEWLGRLEAEGVFHEVGRSSCLVMPSAFYETFGLTIVEAFAKGTPVIASRLGAMAELIDDGRTGDLFTHGDHVQLADTVTRFFADPHRQLKMRPQARLDFETYFTAERNYDLLIGAYNNARAVATGSADPVPEFCQAG